MITSKENLKIPEKHEFFAADLFSEIKRYHLPNKAVIAFCGESGSGKSVATIALYNYLKGLGKKVITLHMDNYFHLPPLKNHKQRVLNINYVGKNEVDLKLLQEHINSFIKNDVSSTLPILNKSGEEFYFHNVNFSNYEYLIVEGTYVYELSNLDRKVFLDLDFTKTRANRIARGRDTINDFSEEVLKIEHNLVKPYAKKADLIVNEKLSISSNQLH